MLTSKRLMGPRGRPAADWWQCGWGKLSQPFPFAFKGCSMRRIPRTTSQGLSQRLATAATGQPLALLNHWGETSQTSKRDSISENTLILLFSLLSFPPATQTGPANCFLLPPRSESVCRTTVNFVSVKSTLEA